MILVAIKDSNNKDQVDNLLNKYFKEKIKPPYKFIDKFEGFSAWAPLLIDPQEYDLEEELVEFLSKDLNLTVFGYEHQDTANYYTVYLYSSGECIDEFRMLDDEILATLGYFMYIDDLSEEEKSDTNAYDILEPYYKKLGFDPNYVSFNDQY